jgi:uncharacterized protein GlcG (DUF336 family)
MELVSPSAILTSRAGLAAVEAAVAKGVGLGRRVNAAVVDTGGNLVAFLRCPGAPLPSASIAQDKAYTSASFGLSTAGWRPVVEGNEALRAGLQARDRLVMFAGGLPIVINGEVVAGIGVSGASEQEDEACARAGLNALGLSDG